MKTMHALLIATLALFAAAAPPALARDATPGFASHADTARYLAGLPPSAGSRLAAIADTAAWRTHARRLDAAWAEIEKRQLGKIKTWSASNIPNPQKTVFYPFSGPDFIYAHAFFPKADTYVLAALEPVGYEPDLVNISEGARIGGLNHLQGSINTIMRLSFFITNEMQAKFRKNQFPGTVPVLLTFLARSGYTVEDVMLANLEPDGTLKEVENKKPATVVKISFTGDDKATKKTLYYFNTDVSDGGFKRSGFQAFLKTLGNLDSFMKSASYLLHKPNFTMVRDFVLENSVHHLQDDTGIPLKHFTEKEWDRLPFGNYARPISIFSNRYQPDLKRLFASDKRRKLDFGIGYKWRPGDSNLLLAIKKES